MIVTFIVGRWLATGDYLRFTREGWPALANEADVMKARRFETAAGLMNEVGGHYRSLEAVLVTADITVGDVVPFPDPTEVWG